MAKDKAQWLAGTLRQHRNVETTKKVSPGLVMVERKESQPCLVGVVSGAKIGLAEIDALLDCRPPPQFIVSVPNDSVWTRDAISSVQEEGIAIGKMYDLYRGLRDDQDLSDYQSPEIYHVERLLRQHRNVSRFERISDRSYEVECRDGKSATIAFSQDYEMTADAVRTAFDLYAPFEVLLKTTPYGGISKQGREAASQLGVEVLNASGLYEKLAE